MAYALPANEVVTNAVAGQSIATLHRNMIDLDALPRILCRDRRPRTEPPTSICLHVPVTPEWEGAAEAVARYLQNPGRVVDGVWQPVTAGIHFCIDSDSDVMCADPRTETVPHCYRPSGWSVGIEIAGTIQSEIEWADDFSQAALRRTARLCAALCVIFDIPVVRLSPLEVASKTRGIFDHNDSSNACRFMGWPQDGHHDVGDAFPWDQFLAMVRAELDPEEDDVNTEVRYGFEPSWARAVGSPIPGRLPEVEVDAREGALRGYGGVTFVVEGSDDGSLTDGDPTSGGVTAVDVSGGRLNGGPVRFTQRLGDTVVFVTQGGGRYAFTAVAP